MYKLLVMLILVLFLLSGCAGLSLDETIDVDPSTIEYCRDLPNVTLEGYPIINPDYCLGKPVKDTEKINGIRQDSYEDYYAYSVAIDGEGRGIGERSTAAHAQMRAYAGTLEIYIQGIAGEWGLGQLITLNRGCYLEKVEGEMDANDRYNPDNYLVGARVYFPNSDTFLHLSDQNIPMHSSFDAIFIFFVDSPQLVDLQIYIKSMYGTPGENSVGILHTSRLVEVPLPFCGTE